MRPVLAGQLLIIAALTALLGAACGSRQVQTRERRLTGTCEGACNHYLACKHSDDDDLFAACFDECAEAFSDAYSLRGFESLSCYDAVAYVEGAGGRQPGEPLSERP